MAVAIVALAMVAFALSVAVKPADDQPRGSRPSGASSPPSSGPASPSVDPGTPTTSPPAPATASLAAPVPQIAVVPIVGFWSTVRSLSMDEVRAALAGRDRRFRLVVVGDPDLAALGARPRRPARPGGRGDSRPAPSSPPSRAGATSSGSSARATFGRRSGRSGRRSDPVRERACALARRSGRSWSRRRRRRSRRPRRSRRRAGFDPGATWTLVAAGDVMNDRDVYRRTVLLGRGPDFPWNGGTARIVRRTCCSVGLTTVTGAPDRRRGRRGRALQGRRPRPRQS